MVGGGGGGGGGGEEVKSAAAKVAAASKLRPHRSADEPGGKSGQQVLSLAPPLPTASAELYRVLLGFRSFNGFCRV